MANCFDLRIYLLPRHPLAIQIPQPIDDEGNYQEGIKFFMEIFIAESSDFWQNVNTKMKKSIYNPKFVRRILIKSKRKPIGRFYNSEQFINLIK